MGRKKVMITLPPAAIEALDEMMSKEFETSRSAFIARLIADKYRKLVPEYTKTAKQKEREAKRLEKDKFDSMSPEDWCSELGGGLSENSNGIKCCEFRAVPDVQYGSEVKRPSILVELARLKDLYKTKDSAAQRVGVELFWHHKDWRPLKKKEQEGAPWEK